MKFSNDLRLKIVSAIQTPLNSINKGWIPLEVETFSSWKNKCFLVPIAKGKFFLWVQEIFILPTGKRSLLLGKNSPSHFSFPFLLENFSSSQRKVRGRHEKQRRICQTSLYPCQTHRNLNAVVALASAGNQIKLDWASKLGLGPG